MKNSEKGQILPLVLIALALGTLMVSPFLTRASTSLITSGKYAGAIDEQNAADSGVEYAIWQLTYDGLGASIPNVGDQTPLYDGPAIKGITPSITVETISVGGVAGAITDTVLDTLEYDTSNGATPSIVHVSGDYYAIAYTGPGNDGFVKTVQIASNGQIGNAAIDTLEFDTSNGVAPSIVHVSGDYYAIAYTGPSSDGFVNTVTIDSAGQIGNAVIDTLEYDIADGATPNIIHVSGDIYAIAYTGTGSDGFVKTVTIDSAGQIGNAVIDTLEYDISNGVAPSIVHVSGDYYAIAFTGPSNDGFIKTVTIDSAGQIGNAVIDALEYDTSDGFEPDIVHVSGDYYAIAYRGVLNDGFVKTVTIDSAGQIGNAVIDTLEFDTSDASTPSIINTSGDLFAVAYRSQVNTGYLASVQIDALGQIANAVIDLMVFDASAGYDPDIIAVSGDIFTIAYRGASVDGFVTTVDISSTSSASEYQITSTVGSWPDNGYRITAVVTVLGTTVNITSWQVQ
ncbi:MAG: hypothetical protein WC749_11590 [Dehalococcoidia bacterium]